MTRQSVSSVLTLAASVTSLLLCCLITCDGLHRKLVPLRRRDVGELRYGVLLDGGSSSTKIKVYSYTKGQPPTYVPHIKLVKNKSTKLGISDFAATSKAPELSEYIRESLTHASTAVPQNKWASTPVYVMSTAGVRSLSVKDSEALLKHIQEILRQPSVNPFLFKDDHVSVLSGEEEAVYAWVAANYLRGFFSSPMTRNDSVGILEMGGGSMQVAFLPDGPLLQEEFQVYVGHRRFDLYAQSYLNFGANYIRNQVFWRLWKDILDNNKNPSEIKSPCMLSGDNSTYHPPGGGDVVVVKGTGDPAQCEDILRRVLLPNPQDPPCSPAPCAIGDRYQPSVTGMRFYAFSSFLYAPKTLKAIASNGVMDIVELKRNSADYCKLTLDQAVKKTGAKNTLYVSDDCLHGLYISILLTTALGFKDTTTDIILSDKINNSTIDWGLGAMVQQLSMSFLEDYPTNTGIDCRRNNSQLPVLSGRAGLATDSTTTS